MTMSHVKQLVKTAARATILVATAAHAIAAQPTKAWCAKLPRPANAALESVPVKSDWFVVYRAADGVVAIVEPYQWQEAISYLIVGSTRAMLFYHGHRRRTDPARRRVAHVAAGGRAQLAYALRSRRWQLGVCGHRRDGYTVHARERGRPAACAYRV